MMIRTSCIEEIKEVIQLNFEGKNYNILVSEAKEEHRGWSPSEEEELNIEFSACSGTIPTDKMKVQLGACVEEEGPLRHMESQHIEDLISLNERNFENNGQEDREENVINDVVQESDDNTVRGSGAKGLVRSNEDVLMEAQIFRGKDCNCVECKDLCQRIFKGTKESQVEVNQQTTEPHKKEQLKQKGRDFISKSNGRKKREGQKKI